MFIKLNKYNKKDKCAEQYVIINIKSIVSVVDVITGSVITLDNGNTMFVKESVPFVWQYITLVQDAAAETD